ncbi:GNAT family N-acetyltransferase [Catellatospora sp. NPDC049609]|uniref:GNAT family N-acetyltransferase n=1 Tax=Catellatospora sp. NPDC049609 TaxID=3155505 RepID=UPI00343CD352
MFEVRGATEPEIETWRAGWAARLRERYAARYRDPAAVAREVERNLAAQAGDGGAVYTVEVGGAPAGHLALGGAVPRRPDDRRLFDLWLAPERRGRGLARPLVAWARRQAAAGGGARLSVAVVPGDAASDALFGAYPLRAQQMVTTVAAGVTLPDGICGRAMTEAEFGPWRADRVRLYAESVAASGALPPADAQARAAAEFDALLPGGLATDGQRFHCLVHDGQVVGTIWLEHALLPGVSFVNGVDVGAAHRGRGYGRAAMLLGAQATAAAGDAQLALNVFGHNTVARRLYDSLGYQVVEQFRADDL